MTKNITMKGYKMTKNNEVRIRIKETHLDMLSAFYSEQGQTFPSHSRMVDSILDTIIKNNMIDLVGINNVLDSTFENILNSNMGELTETVSRNLISPIREQTIQLNMISSMLVDVLYLGLTESEKSKNLLQLRKEAVSRVSSSNRLLNLNELSKD